MADQGRGEVPDDWADFIDWRAEDLHRRPGDHIWRPSGGPSMETAKDQPTIFDLIGELRREVGLFDGAMSITPKEAWEEALDLVRRQRRLLTEVDRRVPYDADPELLDLVGRTLRG